MKCFKGVQLFTQGICYIPSVYCKYFYYIYNGLESKSALAAYPSCTFVIEFSIYCVKPITTKLKVADINPLHSPWNRWFFPTLQSKLLKNVLNLALYYTVLISV